MLYYIFKLHVYIPVFAVFVFVAFLSVKLKEACATFNMDGLKVALGIFEAVVGCCSVSCINHTHACEFCVYVHVKVHLLWIF